MYIKKSLRTEFEGHHVLSDKVYIATESLNLNFRQLFSDNIKHFVAEQTV